MRPLVLLDVDGVLGDFVTPAFVIGNALREGRCRLPKAVADLDQWDIGRFLELDERDQALMYQEIKAPDFHRHIKPYPGAVKGVEALRAVAEVHVVTSPMHGETWCSDRWGWLRDHFGLRAHDVTHTHRKELVRGDVFVDDKPENVERWQAAHPQGLGMLWSQSWNTAHPLARICSWEGVLALVKERTS